MNKKLTVLSVIIAHIGAITGLVFIAGCQSRSGYEGQHNLSAFNGRPSSNNSGFGGPGDVGVSGFSGSSSAKAKPVQQLPANDAVVNPPSAAEAPSTAYSGSAAEPTLAATSAPEPTVAVAVVETRVVEEPVAPVGAGRNYIVKKNDSFWLIAKREGVTSDEIAAANGLSKNAILREGQTLVIPASSGRKAVVKESKPTVAVSSEKYTVKAGDSISVIARRLGTTQANLRAANALKNDNIRVGQVLKVPADARNKTASAPAPTAKAVAPTAAKPASKAVAKTSSTESAPAPKAAVAPASGLRDIPAFGTPAEASAPAPAPEPASAPAPDSEVVEVTAVGV